MSEESTPTRTETVTANIAAVTGKNGDEALLKIIAQCAQDISLSLAALVDAESTTNTGT